MGKSGRPPGAKNKIPPYIPKHEFTRDMPKGFQQVTDSAIDHIGELIDRSDLVEIGGFILGLNSGVKLHLDPDKILIMGLSGMFAVRGLQSRSEIVGAASIGTLIFLGAAIAGSGTEKALGTMRKNRELFLEMDKASPERKAAIIEKLKKSIQEINE